MPFIQHRDTDGPFSPQLLLFSINEPLIMSDYKNYHVEILRFVFWLPCIVKSFLMLKSQINGEIYPAVLLSYGRSNFCLIIFMCAMLVYFVSVLSNCPKALRIARWHIFSFKNPHIRILYSWESSHGMIMHRWMHVMVRVTIYELVHICIYLYLYKFVHI